MRHLPHTLAACLMLTAGSLATGCASTAKGVETSVLRGGPPVALQQEVPSGTVLAVVRYPAFVDSAAETAFATAYGQTAFGGTVKKPDAVEVGALADSVVLKSNYFAMSLYRELAARLPEHAVLLSPHEITLADDGSLTSVPMTAAESLPSVVTVDFTAYTYPDVAAMMGDKPLTFGDLVTPVVSVRTDPRASVASEGLLLASTPVRAAAAGTNRAQALSDAARLEQGSFDAGVPELDFIATLSGEPRANVASVSLSRAKAGAVRDYPIEKIQMQGAALRTLDDTKTDVLEVPFTNGFANQIVSLINQTDAAKAAMFKRAGAISGYDDSLAALTLVGSDAPDYLARTRYADRLLEAEQKYLSVQSLRLYDGVVNGEMGAQVREILQEEFRVLERRRELARQQNIATAAAIAAAVGGVAMGSQNNNGRGPTYGQQAAQQALIQAAIFSVGEAMRKNRQSKAVGTNYIQSVVPALNATTEVQVDLIDSSETITAIRFEDLKAKLAELYAENQRALDTTATRCRYTGPSGNGTWLGACNGGVADGAGVGVFKNIRGETVEHYGYARDGRADGPGYRIVRAPEGSYSIEGSFQAGRANGPVRVERSGSVQLRRYNDGQDVGAAPAGTIVASPFTTGARTT